MVITPSYNLDIDTTLGGANASDYIIPSQKAVKNYVDNHSGGGGSSVSSRKIGEIVWSSLPLSDAGLHLLDGTLLSIDGIYNEFVNYIGDLYVSGIEESNTTVSPKIDPELGIPIPFYFCTEEEWQTSVSTYGVCGKFVYDGENNTVRLPKVTGIVEGTTDVSVLGDLVEAGLPNITGAMGESVAYGSTSGAITQTTTSRKFGGGGSSYGTASRSFDASGSSSIYGNSSTVQPQTIKVFCYIVVATSTNTDIQVNIDNIASDLNGKADTDLSNINASQSAKNTVMSWMLPDTANGITITSGFTAPSLGWISINGFTQSSGTNTNVFVNGVKVSGIASGGGMVSNATQFPVDKGDVITWNNGVTTLLFFPMKGVS